MSIRRRDAAAASAPPARRAGGAATAGGVDYQARVAAWIGVHILAERAQPLPWGLVHATAVRLWCETEEPVDDLLVETSQEGKIWIQAKRSLTLSPAPDSELGGTIDQMVRQWLFGRQGAHAGGQHVPLDSERDCLVLATSSATPASIRAHLSQVVDRLRSSPPGRRLTEAARNERERRALTVLLGHVSQAWRRATGRSPSAEEQRAFLQLLRVDTIDVEPGRAGENNALQLLRTEILAVPEQAGAAWARLITEKVRLATEQSGVHREGLETVLLGAGCDLRGPRSYRGDIERLRRQTRVALTDLQDLAVLEIRGRTIKIVRPSGDALAVAAQDGSILVIGEPGAGKSGVLHDLVTRLQAVVGDVVFLPADRFSVRTMGELHLALRLEHDFDEVLRNWPGRAPAYLVVDGLDAARTEGTAVVFRDLLARVMGAATRWRVVASIRIYDLRYGPRFRSLFRGEPVPGYETPEFRALRHFTIRRLVADELDQVWRQSPEFEALVEAAPSALRELLGVPFNLRLVADLLTAGMAPADLTPLRTQLELLDRYWDARVCDDSRANAREVLLSRACLRMVERRSFRVARTDVATAGPSEVLEDLLSRHVLVEDGAPAEGRPGRELLRFPHHILFDYAVARLLFRVAPDALITRLSAEPELFLLVRPSVLLHFQHVWETDRARHAFWNLVVDMIQATGLPEVAKLVGPSVAADLAKTVGGLEPLCAALEANDTALREAAGRAFGHLVGRLVSSSPPGEGILMGASPWAGLLERVSRTLRPDLGFPVRVLLSKLCERPDRLSVEERRDLGLAARRLLSFARVAVPRNDGLVIDALRTVCRTFTGDPAASAELIRQGLTPEYLDRHGAEEMHWLADEVTHILPHDPGLAQAIYVAAFVREETSVEETLMGGGQLLSLVSNRRQDWEHARYVLAERKYRHFLDSAPEQATRTLIAVLDAYVSRNHAPASGTWDKITFEIVGEPACLRTDYSAIWDNSDRHPGDYALQLLDELERYLEHQAERNPEPIRPIIRVVFRENRVAVIWRRLLRLGAHHPATVGAELRELAWTPALLTAYDTTTVAGEFLSAIHPRMTPEDRERVERAILAIGTEHEEGEADAAREDQNRLLGCLAEGDLVVPEAKTLLAELRARNEVPANEPPFRFTSESRPYGEEEHLAHQGVDVAAEANRRFREIEAPVKAFAKQSGSSPTIDEVMALLPALTALRDAIARADTDGVDPGQRDYGWGTLAEAAAKAARVAELSCTVPAGDLVRAILLEASQHPDPEFDAESEARFNTSLSWSGPFPRIEAADGLTWLVGQPGCASVDMSAAIERLSRDAVAPVRFQVVKYLRRLYRIAPDLMQTIIERVAHEEPNRGVLQGLLTATLDPLAGAHPERVVPLLQLIRERVVDGLGADEVRKLAWKTLVGLYLWRDNPACGAAINEVIARPEHALEDANTLVFSLRKPLTHGAVAPPDPNEEGVRRRALDAAAGLVTSAHGALRAIEERHRAVPTSSWPAPDRELARDLARLLSHLATEIDHASDLRDLNDPAERGAVRLRFYREAGPILDALAGIPIAPMIHHLVKTFEHCVECDPKEVFLRVARAIQTGAEAGYQYEPLAVDQIVELVQRYLAEHPEIFETDRACQRALLEVLDLFVRAGWPKAWHLVYQLDALYR